MGPSFRLEMVPAVELTESRMRRWDEICLHLGEDSLSGYLLSNDLIESDSRVAAAQALKSEYGFRVSNYYRDVQIRLIHGIRYMFSGTMSWGDDLPQSAVLFMKIAEISEIYDWLESEAVVEAETSKVLDIEKAEQFMRGENSFDLSKMTEITADAAKIISEYGGNLCLDGLTNLSDEIANLLSDFQGDLTLNGLAELSNCAASSLAQIQGDLSIDGLTRLSDDAAEAFSNHQGRLSLGGLTVLSAAAAEFLSMNEGALYLHGLEYLADDAAEALAYHRGSLFLIGLKELSDEAVESLSKHHGRLCLGKLVKNQ